MAYLSFNHTSVYTRKIILSPQTALYKWGRQTFQATYGYIRDLSSPASWEPSDGGALSAPYYRHPRVIHHRWSIGYRRAIFFKGVSNLHVVEKTSTRLNETILPKTVMLCARTWKLFSSCRRRTRLSAKYNHLLSTWMNWTWVMSPFTWEIFFVQCCVNTQACGIAPLDKSRLPATWSIWSQGLDLSPKHLFVLATSLGRSGTKTSKRCLK